MADCTSGSGWEHRSARGFPSGLNDMNSFQVNTQGLSWDRGLALQLPNEGQEYETARGLSVVSVLRIDLRTFQSFQVGRSVSQSHIFWPQGWCLRTAYFLGERWTQRHRQGTAMKTSTDGARKGLGKGIQPHQLSPNF